MMDCTQITFSLSVNVPSGNDVCISLGGNDFDLGAFLQLTVDKPLCGIGSLFFTLHSSLENAMYHVCEGFEKTVISIGNSVRKFVAAARSMWRERIAPAKLPRFAKHSSFMVLRT